MPINPNYIKVATNEIETRKKFPICLDIADTIYITNYLLGYFAPSKDASELMRFQKIEDLKKKNIWENYEPPFLKSAVIDKDFGVNVYFATEVPQHRETQLRQHITSLHRKVRRSDLRDTFSVQLTLVQQTSFLF